MNRARCSQCGGTKCITYFRVLPNETLDLFKQALASGGDLAKSGMGTGWTQPGNATTGLQPYDQRKERRRLWRGGDRPSSTLMKEDA